MRRDGRRRSLWLALLLGGIGLSACASAPKAMTPPPASPPGGSVFHEVLSAHGTWENIQGVGTVWRPSPTIVGRAFVPYVSHGRWVWSQERWVFLSDFSWGWATFHYGRWFHTTSYGWQWVPDSRWAPAWVDWRYGGGYISWSPTPPARFSGKPRAHMVEARHFTSRQLLLHEASETLASAAALESFEPEYLAELGEAPSPPEALVRAATGRPLPEPTRAEARREQRARLAFAPPEPPVEVAAATPSAVLAEARRPTPKELRRPAKQRIEKSSKKAKSKRRHSAGRATRGGRKARPAR